MAYHQHVFLSRSSRGWKSGVRGQHGQVLVGTLLPDADCPLLASPLVGKELCGGPSKKDTNPICKAPPSWPKAMMLGGLGIPQILS